MKFWMLTKFRLYTVNPLGTRFKHAPGHRSLFGYREGGDGGQADTLSQLVLTQRRSNSEPQEGFGLA
jgi:hypothetical protein